MDVRHSIAGLICTAFLCIGPALADDDHPIGDAVHALPLFDAHIHYKQPAWDAYPPASVIELMDKNGVAMGLVSSTPDEGTIRLWEYAPTRIVPELRPYHGSAGSSNWTKSPGIEDYLLERLDKYPHEGLGEFHIHQIDPSDEPLLRKVTAMAKARNIPIHIHSGAAPVNLLYRLEPALTIIWAHAGMSEPANIVEEMMAKHKTLYADTSFRENDILDAGPSLDPDWERVLKRFSKRFMVGTDTWVNGQWARYSELIAINRLWLSLLPRDTAERIAYKNAEELFGRSISNQQIGTR
ncbi:MAG: amidohydrolase family protein [Rhizobiaceae bacterium]|nr:amidohydrolase family protein [Rhizobiaceae bacterium]